MPRSFITFLKLQQRFELHQTPVLEVLTSKYIGSGNNYEVRNLLGRIRARVWQVGFVVDKMALG
jgi:hypothetical protein